MSLHSSQQNGRIVNKHRQVLHKEIGIPKTHIHHSKRCNLPATCHFLNEPYQVASTI